MSELFILKNGENYFRFQGEEAVSCNLQKASVFPLDALAEVTARRNQLRNQGYPDAAIYTLTITETPFEK